MASENLPKPRKGLSLACEGCRKKKIRCSGEPGPCAGCVQSKVTCHFSGYVKPRRTPVRAHRRINGLEERLAELERLLQEKDKQLPAAPETQPRLETMQEGRGAQGAATISTDVWSKSFEPLPSLEDFTNLMSQYFKVANVTFPIFEEAVIMPLVRMEFRNLAANYGAVWTAVNVILALAHQQQAAYPLREGLDHQAKALLYLQNAVQMMEGFHGLRNPCILSAQCLLGIAEVYRASPTPQKSSMYIAMVVRQIYHLGIHRADTSTSADSFQNIISYRLFWIAYCIDRDISLRLHHPPMLSASETNLVLGPRKGVRDDIQFIREQNQALHTALIRKAVDLAAIQDATFRALDTSRDESRTSETSRQVECEIATSLEQWLDDLDVDFSPEALSRTYTPPDIVCLAVLFGRYFNTLTTVHRLSYWSVQDMDVYKSSFANITGTTYPSQALCIRSARRLLGLFPILPHGNVPCQWLLIDYFVSAAVILLAGMIYNSSFNHGARDLGLVRPILEQLERLKTYGDADRLDFIGKNCAELAKVAASIHDSRVVIMERYEERGSANE